MTSKGVLKAVERLYSGKYSVTLLLDRVNNIEALNGADLDVEIKKHREKRSLNANAYFHVLVMRIAEALHTSNTEVKNRLIREYGAFEFIQEQIPTFKLKAEYEDAMLNREDIHVKPIGRDYADGCEWVRFAFMRGSHTYNSAEMARLIDGTVQEAKDLGIETLTPDQIERMKAAWRTISAEKTAPGGM